ncbi:MAG: hypothetical protein ACXV8J_08435 [Methylobacter sp.]
MMCAFSGYTRSARCSVADDPAVRDVAAVSVIWADGGYSGVLVERAKSMLNWNLSIAKRMGAMRGKFVVLPLDFKRQ